MIIASINVKEINLYGCSRWNDPIFSSRLQKIMGLIDLLSSFDRGEEMKLRWISSMATSAMAAKVVAWCWTHYFSCHSFFCIVWNRIPLFMIRHKGCFMNRMCDKCSEMKWVSWFPLIIEMENLISMKGKILNWVILLIGCLSVITITRISEYIELINVELKQSMIRAKFNIHLKK